MSRIAAGVLLALAGCACGRKPAPAPFAPDTFEAQWNAARERFEAANRKVMRWSLAMAPAPLTTLLEAEERLTSDQRAEIRPLAEEGKAFARRAIELRPEHPAGHLYLALNLAMEALARSRASALLESLPGKIRAACAASLARDRTFREGGALRLQGRFLTTAPWPVRDLEKGARDLEEALAIAPIPFHYLFLGDARWRQGRREEARALWRAAADARDSLHAPEFDALARAAARARLKAPER